MPSESVMTSRGFLALIQANGDLYWVRPDAVAAVTPASRFDADATTKVAVYGEDAPVRVMESMETIFAAMDAASAAEVA